MPFNPSKELPSEQIIKDAAERNGIPFLAFKNLIWAESGGIHTAQSEADSKGRRAWGLGQLRGPAMQDMGLAWEDRLDPVKNADAAARYYKRMLDNTGNDTVLASLAYYKGLGSDDVTAYREGRFNDITPEGKKRVSVMSGTAEKRPDESVAFIPPTQFEYTPESLEQPTTAEPQPNIAPSLFDSGLGQPYAELPTVQKMMDAEKGRDAGFIEQTVRAFDESFLENGGFATWEKGGYGQRTVQAILPDSFTRMNRKTRFSEEFVQEVKDSGLDPMNYGRFDYFSEKEARELLPVLLAEQGKRYDYQADKIDVGMPAALVGGLAADIPTPGGMAAVAADVLLTKGMGTAARTSKLIYGWAKPAAQTFGKQGGVITKAMKMDVHPVIKSAGQITKGVAVGATMGAVGEGVVQHAREQMGYYHTPDDLQQSLIDGAVVGGLLMGAGSALREGYRGVSGYYNRQGPQKTLEEAQGEAATTPVQQVENVSKSDTDALEGLIKDVADNAPEIETQFDLERKAKTLMPRAEIKVWKSDIANAEHAISQLEAQKADLTKTEAKGSGKDLTKNREAKKESLAKIEEELTYLKERLEFARNKIKGHVEGGEYYEASRRLSKQNQMATLKSQVEKLLADKDAATAKRDAIPEDETSTGTDKRKRNNLSGKIDEIDAEVARINTEIDNIRQTKETLYTRHSAVSPQTRALLKTIFNMSDDNVDRITEGQAYDYLERHQRMVDKAAEVQNRAKQSVDALREGVNDPAFKPEHEAGRTMHTDGKEVFSVDEGVEINTDNPTSIPTVRLADGIVVDGTSPANPILKEAIRKQEKKVNPARVSTGKIGKLKGLAQAVGSIFVNWRDLSSVIYDSNIVQVADRARRYAVKAAGEMTDGTHSMFRSDGKATMEDIIRDVDGQYHKMIKILEKTERALKKEFGYSSLTNGERQNLMGRVVVQAIEDTTGEFYKALPDVLKPAVDAVREYNVQFYDKFQNPHQFNPDLDPKVVESFRTRYSPENYYTRNVDANAVSYWNDLAEEKFGVDHSAILHKQMMAGFDKSQIVRDNFRSWLANNSLIKGVDWKTIDDVTLRKLYLDEARKKSENIVNLDKGDVDVIDGRMVDDELNKVVHSDSGFEPYESAKMMKERFPMDTSVEIDIVSMDGKSYKYSYDKDIRNTDLGDTLFRYHRVAGSELANRAAHGHSFAAEMMHLDALTKEASRIKNPTEKIRAIRAIEGMRRMQMVMRKNPRVQTDNMLSKIGQLTTNTSYYAANWSFGLMNGAEAGLSVSHHMAAMLNQNFPDVFDSKFGQNVKMTRGMQEQFSAHLISAEAQRNLMPNRDRIRESNERIFGDGSLSNLMSNVEYASESMLHNQWTNRGNAAATDLAFTYGQRVGLDQIFMDAVRGKKNNKYLLEKYFDSYGIKADEYEGLMEMIRNNVSIHNGEVVFADKRLFNTTREGYILRKIAEFHGREGLQVQLPGQQMYGNMGPIWKMFFQFRDFARRSINRSKYIMAQAHHQDRKGEMFSAGLINYGFDAAMLTARVNLMSMALPASEREDFINSRLAMETPLLLMMRRASLGWVNAATIPLGFAGIDPTAAVRQTTGYGGFNQFSSPDSLLRNIGGATMGGAPGIKSALSGAYSIADIGRIIYNRNNTIERNRALDDLQRDVRNFTMGNPITIPIAKGLDQLYY